MKLKTLTIAAAFLLAGCSYQGDYADLAGQTVVVHFTDALTIQQTWPEVMPVDAWACFADRDAQGNLIADNPEDPCLRPTVKHPDGSERLADCEIFVPPGNKQLFFHELAHCADGLWH